MCPEALGARPAQAQHNKRLPPASLPLAMACWHLALLLTGVLLAGEPSLGLAHPRVEWETVGDYGVSWYQQRAGSAPRLLLHYRSEEDSHTGSGSPL